MRATRAALLIGIAARCRADVVEIGADGSARAEPPFISVGVKFDATTSASIGILREEDSVAAALRYVYDVRKINPDVDFAGRIADILEANGAAEARAKGGSSLQDARVARA